MVMETQLKHKVGEDEDDDGDTIKTWKLLWMMPFFNRYIYIYIANYFPNFVWIPNFVSSHTKISVYIYILLISQIPFLVAN